MNLENLHAPPVRCSIWFAALFGSKSRLRVGLKESAARTAERADGNALFGRRLRSGPGGLLRCPFDPVADQAPSQVKIDDEPLDHFAIALGAPRLRRAHAWASQRKI